MYKIAQQNDPEVPFINPFQEIVFSEETPLPGTPKIHQAEMAHCVRLIEQKVAIAKNQQNSRSHGELISISAPLAGFGKSHLIKRISREVLDLVMVLELPVQPNIEWTEILNFTIQHHHSDQSPDHPLGCSVLDECAAFYLSHLIKSAISAEVIEERECPASISTREDDFFVPFSEGVRTKLLGWLKKKGALLSGSVELPRTYFHGFSRDDVRFWTDYFVSHFRHDPEKTSSILSDLSDSEARRRVIQLMRMSSAFRPLLIIVDHLDSCHGSDSAGMEVATAMTMLSEGIPNSVVIFSVNEDIWESVFQTRLPSALLDRMNGESLALAPISMEDAKDLLINRLCNSGVSFQLSNQFAFRVADENRWESPNAELFPRKVIRQAKEAWEKIGEEYSPPPGVAIEPVDTDLVTHFEIDLEAPAAPVETPESLESAFEPEVTPENYSRFAPPTEVNHNESREIIPQTPINPEANPQSSIPLREDTPPSVVEEKLQTGRIVDLPTPEGSGSYPHSQQAATPVTQHNDEPVRSAAASTTTPISPNGQGANGSHPTKINGHNGGQIKATANHGNRTPMEVYFDQLEEHFMAQVDSLNMDFGVLEGFIKTVGNNHSPLEQTEISIVGGQSACLSWDLSTSNVMIGFEPARNSFYYGNMLQKLLADPSGIPSKIVCFAHPSEPFHKELMATNGIDTDTLNQYFDFIQLNNRELALIYAGAKFLKETIEKGCGEDGLKLVLKKLNPLWQRICRPV